MQELEPLTNGPLHVAHMHTATPSQLAEHALEEPISHDTAGQTHAVLHVALCSDLVALPEFAASFTSTMPLSMGTGPLLEAP